MPKQPYFNGYMIMLYALIAPLAFSVLLSVVPFCFFETLWEIADHSHREFA